MGLRARPHENERTKPADQASETAREPFLSASAVSPRCRRVAAPRLAALLSCRARFDGHWPKPAQGSFRSMLIILFLRGGSPGSCA